MVRILGSTHVVRAWKRAFNPPPSGHPPAVHRTDKPIPADLVKHPYGNLPLLQLGTLLGKSGATTIDVRYPMEALEEDPVILALGPGGKRPYLLTLYAVREGGQLRLVVADLQKAIDQRRPGPDLYVMGEGHYLTIGRGSGHDLVVHSGDRKYRNVSRRHLAVVFPPGGRELVIVDASSKGTLPQTLQSSGIARRHTNVPTRITASMIEGNVYSFADPGSAV